MKWLKKALFWFNILLSAGLLIASMATTIPASPFPIIGFIGMAYPYLMALVIVAAVFQLLVPIWWSVFPIGALVLCFPLHFRYLNVPIFSANIQEGAELNIVSYNVYNFRVYDKPADRIKLRDAIIADLKAQKADVYCFQEFFSGENNLQNIAILQKELGTPYYGFAQFNGSKLNSKFGLAIFSKFPLTNMQFAKFDNTISNGWQSVDLIRGKDTFHILNVHFQSIGLQKSDALDLNPETIREETGDAIAVYSKFKQAYKQREAQLKQVLALLKSKKQIVCGDFNEPPVSYVYEKFHERLYDSFEESGRWIGSTYNGRIPFLRIDYVLYSRDLACSQSSVLYKSKLTDHFPIAATIGNKEN